jgi:F420-dependent oxidoreductase-like protein
MEFRVFIEPQQGASYTDQLHVVQAAERLGFAAFFRSDHYAAMSGDGLPGPTDAWVTLGAIARETSRIRLGTLVSSATFRYPGPLAITVAQVDAMSEGRVEFGLGSGWFEEEHRAYGIPFPPLRERFDRLAEQLDIITGLWTTNPGETFDYSGEHYTIADSPALPKPVQDPHPPIVIGGFGAKRTPRLAAEHAAEFNIAFAPLEVAEAQFERVTEAIAAAGRAADSIVYSAAFLICAGRHDA